jgi:hypothetical protein
MKLENEQIKSLISMLNSKDNDNKMIAYELLKKFDLDSHIGEILYINSIAEVSLVDLLKHFPEAYYKIDQLCLSENITVISTLKLCHKLKIIKKYGSKRSLNLFLKHINDTYSKIFIELGYLPEDLEIIIKLKNDKRR